MAKYRKKPVVIEASRWWENGDHPKDREGQPPEYEANGWEGAVVRFYRHPAVDGRKPCSQCGYVMLHHGWIDTLEGGHIVCPGDWIITGVQGENYPCKPAIFEATYEAVE
jgi:hypothetical protein